MNRLRLIRIVLVLVVVLVLGSLSLAIHRNTEPVYLNRTLTTWLREDLVGPSHFAYYSSSGGQYWDSRNGQTNTPALPPTATAIKQIGPAAIPFLLEWSQADDTPIRMRVVNWLNLHTPVHFQVESAGAKHAMAHLGFAMLGDEARPAWTALIRLTRARNSEHRYWAFNCLLACQPDRETLLPVLNRLIHDPDTAIQFFAAHVFHDRYPQEAEAAGLYKMLPFLKEQSTKSPSTTKPAPSK